ncbi:MAG: TerB family tellurite resistance protein [Bacteroidales bacterium]|nr:TerB family tellurite resistance protein [Bacteroidales bacterium]
MKAIYQLLTGVAGWTLGGPIGALLVSIGVLESSRYIEKLTSEKKKFQTQYGDLALSTLVLMKWIALANEGLAKSERLFIKSFLLQEFGIDAKTLGEKALLSSDINLSKKQIELVIKQIKQNTTEEERLLLIDLLYRLALSDHAMQTKEFSRLNVLAQRLGISQQALDQLKGIHHISDSKITAKENDLISLSFQVLELNKGASIQAIEIAYQKARLKFHPDRIKHLGPLAQQKALKQLESIKKAYLIALSTKQ